MALNIFLTEMRPTQVYADSITANLYKMAEEAGIAKVLWKPYELGYVKASELVDPLTEGLKLLKSDPERFKKFNSRNGCGDYESFLYSVEDYLNACKAHPNATIQVC